MRLQVALRSVFLVAARPLLMFWLWTSSCGGEGKGAGELDAAPNAPSDAAAVDGGRDSEANGGDAGSDAALDAGSGYEDAGADATLDAAPEDAGQDAAPDASAEIVVHADQDLGAFNRDILGTNNPSAGWFWSPFIADPYSFPDGADPREEFSSLAGFIAHPLVRTEDQGWKESRGDLAARDCWGFCADACEDDCRPRLDGPCFPPWLGPAEFLTQHAAAGATTTFMISLQQTNDASDAADLVEYLDAADGDWADRRGLDGHPDPWGVRYFSIGNEVNLEGFNPGGCAEKPGVEAYAEIVSEYAAAMRAVDPTIRIGAVAAVPGACGFPDDDTSQDENGNGNPMDDCDEALRWNRYLLEHVGTEIDYLDLHLYDGYEAGGAGLPYGFVSSGDYDVSLDHDFEEAGNYSLHLQALGAPGEYHELTLDGAPASQFEIPSRGLQIEEVVIQLGEVGAGPHTLRLQGPRIALKYATIGVVDPITGEETPGSERKLVVNPAYEILDPALSADSLLYVRLAYSAGERALLLDGVVSEIDLYSPNPEVRIAISEWGSIPRYGFHWETVAAAARVIGFARAPAILFANHWRAMEIGGSSHDSSADVLVRGPAPGGGWDVRMRPDYYSFREIFGALEGDRVEASVESPTFAVSAAGIELDVSLVDALAVRSADGRTLRVVIVNKNAMDGYQWRLRVEGFDPVAGETTVATITTLAGAEIDADNEKYDHVVPITSELGEVGATVELDLPRLSITLLELQHVSR